jgi:hypothetical protein
VKQTTASDSQGMSDSLGSKSITRVLTESVIITETVQKSFLRTLLDTIASSDSLSTSLTAVRTLLETVSLVDIVFFWRPRTKPVTSWAERSVPSDSWSDRTPPTTPWS